MKFKLSLVLSIFAMVLSVFPFSAQAVEQNSKKIERMSPSKISEYIESTKGQKRIIMIYASWCPICVKKMPHIIDFERIKKGSVIAISVDENQKHFSRYIKKLDEIPFRVILNNSSEDKLAKALKVFGVNSWEGVPEIILLDENNNAKGQGNYQLDYIAEFLFGDEE